MKIQYPYRVTPEDDGFIVQFIDLDDCFTEGDTLEEAHFNAAEVLSMVLQGRIEDGFDVPAPSLTEAGDKKGKDIYYATPEPDIQVALLVHNVRLEKDTSLTELARLLDTSWPSAQRFEKPGNNPTLKKLNAVASGLGKRLVVSFE
jgi:antitoxin HicB